MPSIRIANYRQEVEDAIEAAKSLDIAVAFASEQGLSFGYIKQKLTELLEKGGVLRVIVDLKLANTDPAFLAGLLNLEAKGFRVECRAYTIKADGIFHPKIYLFTLQDGSIRIILGSANWTKQAYSTNVEYGLVIQDYTRDKIIKSAKKFFQDLWESPNAKRIDSTSLEIYRKYWRRRRGLDRRAHTHSKSLWTELQENLATHELTPGLKWPTKDVAVLLGCLAARGSINRRQKIINITFRYGGGAYRHHGRRGFIGKGNISYKASRVVHLIPKDVANRISKVVFPAIPKVIKLGKWTYKVEVDCAKNPQLLDELKIFFANNVDYHSFHIPNQIMRAGRIFQKEFMRGYALACGLVSEGTYDPTHHHQVWLRPTTDNTAQFNEIIALLGRRLGIQAYEHRRTDRDVEIKVRCEAWLGIGFDIGWLDALVQEGARLNSALTPP